MSENNLANHPVIVNMSGIHKTYLLGVEGVVALRGVNLQVKAGEFVIIYGTSGGGKTSLLNICGTIDQPTKGGLTLFDTRIDRRTKERELADIRMHRMGFVFQTFNLISSMTAMENVELPLILRGDVSQSERRERAKLMLERVGMGPRMYHLPSQLSGGEQQRVTIARALINCPDLLLLDEPTGDLDTRNTDIVMDLLVKLNAEGITMVMVTHDDSLKNCAHRIVHMFDGRIHKIKTVSPEDRAEQINRLRSATRTLRTGLVSGGQSQEHVPTKPHTTIRRPAQYVMAPTAISYPVANRRENVPPSTTPTPTHSVPVYTALPDSSRTAKVMNGHINSDGEAKSSPDSRLPNGLPTLEDGKENEPLASVRWS